MATHKELITSGKFDEKFKRALLDYYCYGFKNLKSFDTKKSQTMSEDWLRLNRVISDYMEWSEDSKLVMFASADSQSMNVNPFHRIYRFCKYNPLTYPMYFLHTMAALSNKFRLRGGVDALDLDDDQRNHLEDIINREVRLKTSDLIYFYPKKLVISDGDDKNKTPNNRLNDLFQIGLVSCEQHKEKGNRHWYLSDLTMRRILDSGVAVDKDFEHHFRSALDFFSKYYLFGEVGMFLLDRFSAGEDSPLRFKHQYFMQSLNDFNILDLLYAIENGKWCKIKYRHGMADRKTELLCYPLEIRISNMQGRESLMYYEPFHRSYTALRIEFIDSIEFYDDKRIKTFLAQKEIQKEYHTSSGSVDADIINARKAIQYSWGVSTTKEQKNNAVNPVKPHFVSLQIAYNPETEYYIWNRLKRECRFGMVSEKDEKQYISFSVGVSDEVELRPWVRSFYSRILSCDGMDSDGFSVDADVKNIVELLRNDLTLAQEKWNPPVSGMDKWGLSEHVLALLGNGTKAREHDLLFNEIFSIYYYIIADVFTQLCSGTVDKAYTENEIDEVIARSFHKYYLKIGEETENLLPSEIKELLFFGGFLKETKKIVKEEYKLGKNLDTSVFSHKAKEVAVYLPKYACEPDMEMYRDVIPLSTMELRWLKTIVCDKDQKIHLFMSDAEIDMLDDLLKQYIPSLRPIPMDKVIFFDRFHFPEKTSKREAAVLNTLLQSIYDQKTVHITYHTMKNRTKIDSEFRPIILEFSKRNNRFQGFFQECSNNTIYIMNISQIEKVMETDTSFDHAVIEQDFNAFRDQDMVSVEVEFYNVHNMADRILTEFSPWRKRCSYDPETGLYKLTIFYQKTDELDLVVRLLGYGGNVHFVDKEHSICKEIQSRMDRQMELFHNDQRIHSGRKCGNIDDE